MARKISEKNSCWPITWKAAGASSYWICHFILYAGLSTLCIESPFQFLICLPECQYPLLNFFLHARSLRGDFLWLSMKTNCCHPLYTFLINCLVNLSRGRSRLQPSVLCSKTPCKKKKKNSRLLWWIHDAEYKNGYQLPSRMGVKPRAFFKGLMQTPINFVDSDTRGRSLSGQSFSWIYSIPPKSTNRLSDSEAKSLVLVHFWRGHKFLRKTGRFCL